jgi:hypothetical protein
MCAATARRLRRPKGEKVVSSALPSANPHLSQLSPTLHFALGKPEFRAVSGEKLFTDLSQFPRRFALSIGILSFRGQRKQ